MARLDLRPLTLLLAPLVLPACSGGGGSPDGGPDAGAVVITCQNDPRVSAYTPGMSVASPDGTLHFALEQGDPAPPARGTNTWTVKLSDASGNPPAGVQLEAVPFMPDHGHGSSVTPTATANGDGTWTIDNLYFFMPGVWRITLTAAPPDGGAGESGQFLFCVPG
jgi:hypothetical protein